MKKSLLVLVVLSLLTLPTFAREDPPRERRDAGIIKIIKRVFGIQTTGDYLTPPRP